jgi:ABC-type lipoprotein release transport system permease subunit
VLLARADWRVRWRSQLLLAGVLGITLAAVVATLTGAGRSETAFDRLRRQTRASDAIISDQRTEQEDPAGAVTTLERIGGVEGASAYAELFVRPKGTDLFPDYNLWADAPLPGAGSRETNAPLITSGRAVDRTRPDEMIVSEKLASALGVRVGDDVVLESMTDKWVQAAFNGGDPGAPDGPKVRVDVVGLFRTPADFARFSGVLRLSPAFVAEYGMQVHVYSGVYVQLSHDAARRARDGNLQGLRRDFEIGPSPFGDDAATDDGLGTIATALRVLTALEALAGAVVTLLVLGRLTRAALHEQLTLKALGCTRRALVRLVLLVFAPPLLVGIAGGVAFGVVLSPLSLVGLARRIDPMPNAVLLDASVVAGVTVAAVACALLATVLIASRASATSEARTRRTSRGLPVGQPLPAVLGMRYALMRDPSRAGRASRGAIATTSICLAGAVAALVVSASIARLQTDPSLTGQGSGRTIDSGESVETYDKALPRLERDHRVELLAGVHVVFGLSSPGADELSALAYDLRRGDLHPSVLGGRIARHSNEVAVGPTTLHRVHKHIGDAITLRSDKRRADYRIVGVILFPEGDFNHDEGVALTAAGADRLVGDVHDAASLHSIVFDWADGVDAHAADRQLDAAGLQVLTNKTALQPSSVSNLGQVEALPRFLAAFLVLLSVLAIGNALLFSARLRASELATFRALGMTARTSTAIVGSHALAIVGLAVVIGVPLGLAAGIRIWPPIANRAHVVVRAVSPASWISVYALAIVVVASFVAAVAGWRVLRLRPQEVLRSE